MRAPLVLALVLGACITEVVSVDDVVTPGDLAEIAEDYCEAHPELPCGRVWECGPGRWEACVLDDHPLEWAEAYFGGVCEPADDPRFYGHPICWWCCGEGCGKGCNSIDFGCFCPATPMPETGP